MSYAGNGTVISIPASPRSMTGGSRAIAISSQPSNCQQAETKKDCKCGSGCCSSKKGFPTLESGEPDFVKMTTAQKVGIMRNSGRRFGGKSNFIFISIRRPPFYFATMKWSRKRFSHALCCVDHPWSTCGYRVDCFGCVTQHKIS